MNNPSSQSPLHAVYPALNHYTLYDYFTFQPTDNLASVCNAPDNHGGIYFVEEAENNEVLYIGSSGHFIQTKNDFIPRRDGLKGRIVKGKQSMIIGKSACYDKRIRLWPKKMMEDNLSAIRISWFVTHHEKIKHLPAYVEALMIQSFYERNDRLPKWNQKF